MCFSINGKKDAKTKREIFCYFRFYKMTTKRKKQPNKWLKEIFLVFLIIELEKQTKNLFGFSINELKEQLTKRHKIKKNKKIKESKNANNGYTKRQRPHRHTISE